MGLRFHHLAAALWLFVGLFGEVPANATLFQRNTKKSSHSSSRPMHKVSCCATVTANLERGEQASLSA
jgi:hypothetical protein